MTWDDLTTLLTLRLANDSSAVAGDILDLLDDQGAPETRLILEVGLASPEGQPEPLGYQATSLSQVAPETSQVPKAVLAQVNRPQWDLRALRSALTKALGSRKTQPSQIIEIRYLEYPEALTVPEVPSEPEAPTEPEAPSVPSVPEAIPSASLRTARPRKLVYNHEDLLRTYGAGAGLQDVW